MKNLCQCDQCDKIAVMIEFASEKFGLPSSWEHTDVGDLCPNCFRKWRNVMVEFKERKWRPEKEVAQQLDIDYTGKRKEKK